MILSVSIIIPHVMQVLFQLMQMTHLKAMTSSNTLISKVHAPQQYILKIIMAAFYFICAGTDNILDNPGWPLHVTKLNSLV